MFDAFRRKFDHTPAGAEDRVPPGQYVTAKFPVLHVGEVPDYSDLSTWNLQVIGDISATKEFSFEEVRALPSVTIEDIDIHCVTRWSKLSTSWTGVRFRDFLEHIPPLNANVSHVLAHSEGGYTANLPLDVMLDDDVLLAYLFDGAELEPEHGYPLRLFVPKKYFWKSAKWLRGIEFMTEDRLGFWERYGYNNHADPWLEERYAE